MAKVEQIVLNLLEEGCDDWVPFGSLLWEVQQRAESDSQKDRLIYDVLQYVLGNGLMTVGDLGEQGYEPRSGAVDDLRDRIIQEYEKATFMDAGYICWLANTPEGDRLASRS